MESFAMTKEEIIEMAEQAGFMFTDGSPIGFTYSMLEDFAKLVEEKERTWVGLTDEDMGFLFPHGKSVWVQEIVKIIEAKLKVKNE
jgi:hypothetical protein